MSAAQQPATGEPVQTTPNFTQLMQILDGLNRCHSRDSKVEFLRSWIQDWTQHKVDKLTHPAPSVPATDEPVLTVEREPDYWSGGHFYEGSRPHINPTKVWSLPIGTKLYTRSAPSVPDGYALVPIEPTQAMLKVQTWDFNRFYSPREIWAAMLAAKEKT